ncbi:MAG: hypothetical protein HY587_05915 [Candidatus Omnitrophica bacterium]|nr:hypothetical protein [Candidatus Omnitrophota bacterium]
MKFQWFKFFAVLGLVFICLTAGTFSLQNAYASTSLEIFEISASTASGTPFTMFEGNTPFWGDWSGDPGTDVSRISEPSSINGDGGAWRMTLVDTANGSRRFALAGWALNHLNVVGKTHLDLYARGGSGGETFEVGLSDSAVPKHEIRRNVAPFIVGGGLITTAYKQIRIPLTEFSNGGVVLSNLDAFLVISTAPDGQTNVLYLDAMRFE